MKNNNNQAGRSMIEMLGVLAIIGVLSVGGIAGYSKAMMQYKINKTADQITQIVGNVRTLFGNQKNYEALCGGGHKANFPIIQKAHLVPDEMWNSEKTDLENPFGGWVALNCSNRKTSHDNKAFGVDLGSVPEEACMALATYDWGSGSSSGLIGISVNDGTVLDEKFSAGCNGSYSEGKATACPNASGTGSVSIPMPVNIAATACKAGDDNDISIKFY